MGKIKDRYTYSENYTIEMRYKIPRKLKKKYKKTDVLWVRTYVKPVLLAESININFTLNKDVVTFNG